MRLTLVDRIVDLEPNRRIRAIKSLSLTEDYLRDHFPRFPVMPGVLMLEVMYQASAWLVRVSEEFAHSMVTLSEANNVKYSDFVEPGQSLVVTAEYAGEDERFVKLKCEGTIDGQTAVRARLVLQRYNLSDSRPELKPTDDYIRAQLQRKLGILYSADS